MEVSIRSLTTRAPVEPSFSPIDRAMVVSGSLWVAMTQMSASMTPSVVSTPVSLPPCPTKPFRPTPKCRFAPSSFRLSCTGSAISGSAIWESSHAFSSTMWVSMPRCARAVVISTPSGPDSSTTAFFTSFSVSFSSMPRRMFLT